MSDWPTTEAGAAFLDADLDVNPTPRGYVFTLGMGVWTEVPKDDAVLLAQCRLALGFTTATPQVDAQTFAALVQRVIAIEGLPEF